ncbi:unnamed protein product, partial [Brachionus calyciflorus]
MHKIFLILVILNINQAFLCQIIKIFGSFHFVELKVFQPQESIDNSNFVESNDFLIKTEDCNGFKAQGSNDFGSDKSLESNPIIYVDLQNNLSFLLSIKFDILDEIEHISGYEIKIINQEK